jgi:hypothetical protein
MNLLFIFLAFCFGSIETDKPTVMVFIYEDCPISIYMTKDLASISETYKKDFHFKCIFPHALSNYKTASQFLNKYKLPNCELIIDTDQAITKKYGATITPEVVLINKNDELVYRGRINDGFADIGKKRNQPSDFTLRNVLQKIIQNEEIPKPWADAKGCYITIR